jgi:glycosyltransferase involved in cell wall biosynthesis
VLHGAITARTSSPPRAGLAPLPRAALRIACLAPEYPKVSHTFIRREIRALEQRGVEVLRLAIRRGATVDPADRSEAECTVACLRPWRWRHLLGVAAALRRPLCALRALAMTLSMHRRSDRGLLRHLAYWFEAAILLRVCEAAAVRHVHVHFGTNAAAVARLMRCLGGGRPTYSMTVHGPDEFDAPRAFSLREKVADATFVAAISDFCRAQVCRWSRPEDWHRIHVVRCAIDGAFGQAQRPVPAHSHTLLCVGRLSAQKGHLLLLEAMARVVAARPDAMLVLAGDGEMRSDVERAIAARGLQRHVVLAGWVGEQGLQHLLTEARALVQPSFAEGLPVVLMEAMAMGRPVIATAIAGVPELVVSGENGWLVPAGNVDALALAMQQALDADGARLDALGAAGRARVRVRHDAATEAARLEELLCAAAHGGR